MTTRSYNLLRPFRQQALVAVKTEHCRPPTYKPEQDVKGEMKCPRCRSRLTFNVPAATGLSNGQCVARCGVEWRE